MGADSDEEEKRANRARAASKDPGSAAESRNQSVARDVCPSLHSCFLYIVLPAVSATFGTVCSKSLSLTSLHPCSARCDATID